MTITIDTVRALYHRPLMGLIGEAYNVTQTHHAAHEVQLCTLMSIKTGGCPEDCKYCSQSIANKTDLEKETLQSVDSVLESARAAKDAGSTRFCMGAAWRDVKDGRAFDRVLEMVRGVRSMDLEVCCTLGMLNEDQAKRLKDAGLTAYNHNLDTSEEFYSNVITTRTYQDRINTIEAVSKAGISLCCGGILGMGESEDDRIALLHRLANLNPQPESVPINMLVKVDGTPMADAPDLDIFEWVRCIAVARILMPRAMVRLSAGRLSISREAQALAFMAGANAIFTGEKLLTTANPGQDHDMELLSTLGLKPRPAFKCAS